jgi:hypothetical protein
VVAFWHDDDHMEALGVGYLLNFLTLYPPRNSLSVQKMSCLAQVAFPNYFLMFDGANGAGSVVVHE